MTTPHIEITYEPDQQGFLLTVTSQGQIQEIRIPATSNLSYLAYIFSDQLEIQNQEEEIIKEYQVIPKLKQIYKKYQLKEIAPSIYASNFTTQLFYSLPIAVTKYIEHRLREIEGYVPMVNIVRFTKAIDLFYDDTDNSIGISLTTANILHRDDMNLYRRLKNVILTQTLLYATHLKYKLLIENKHSVKLFKNFLQEIHIILLRDRQDGKPISELHLIKEFNDINQRFIIRETDSYTWTLFDTHAGINNFELNFLTFDKAVRAALYIHLQRYDHNAIFSATPIVIPVSQIK